MKPKLVYDSIQKMGRVFKLVGVPKDDNLGSCYLSLFEMLVKHHGKRMAVKQLKALYNEALRFSCGLPVPVTTPIWTKRDKENFPICLKPFRKSLRAGKSDRRWALSILRVYEAVRLPPEANLGSIIEPSAGPKNYLRWKADFLKFLSNSRFSSWIKEEFEEERLQVLEQRTHRTFHASTKRGIEGPTVLTAGKQSLAIGEYLSDLLEKFNKLFRKGNWAKVLLDSKSYYTNNKDLYQTTTKSTSLLGRISLLPDKGGKTRIVAIGNYWIQDTLLGLHKTLYRVLRKIKSDGTYDQESQSERVKTQSGRGSVWSFDLTAATDRFPLEPQVDVLKSLNPEVGDLWSKILKELTFEFRDNHITYTVGQPMGLYSSWAVFALTHHFIIQYCAWKERESFPFLNYSVLGDDVAIWSPRTAMRYKEIISSLDVSISEAKSFTPNIDSLGKPCVAEFAKRVFDRGEEVTPLPPDICRSLWSIYDIPELLRFLSSHGFLGEAVPVSRIAELYRINSVKLRDFLYLIRTKEVLDTPLRVNLDIPQDPDSELITKELVINQRISLLSDQMIVLEEDLWDFQKKLTGQALEHGLMAPIPENLPILNIFQTRLKDVLELQGKLLAFLEPIEEDMDLLDEMEFEISPREFQTELPPISEIEYLPGLSLDDLIKLCKQPRLRHSQDRGRYLRNLVERLKNSEVEIL